MQCKKCGAELMDGAKFCMKCGTKVEQEILCPQCGTKLPADAAFCFSCGNAMGEIASKRDNSTNDFLSVTKKNEIKPEEKINDYCRGHVGIMRERYSSTLLSVSARNFIEYNGFVYYRIIDRRQAVCTIQCYNLQSLELKIIDSFSFKDGGDVITCPFDDRPTALSQYMLSIYDNKLYYTDGYSILSYDLLNGEHLKMQIFNENDDYFITCCIAFRDRVVFGCSKYGTCFLLDLTTKKYTKYKKESLNNLVGCNSQEIVFKSGKNTYHIIDVYTMEMHSKTIQQMYPKTKNKEVLFVDWEKEIVYCMEKDTDILKGPFVAYDKQGNIADQWELPMFDEKQRDQIETLTFDGERLAIKYNEWADGSNLIAKQLKLSYYDRKGNMINNLIFPDDGSYRRFASLLYMTEHAAGLLARYYFNDIDDDDTAMIFVDVLNIRVNVLGRYL